jgi:hypothetical protein
MPGLTIISRRFFVARNPVLNTQQQESRAKNAVAAFLFRQLIVPKVFVNAPWPDRHRQVDVLAVDRSGAGEVHVVEVKVGAQAVKGVSGAAASLMQIPAHFRYFALFDNNSSFPDEKYLYAPDGMGRVGIIQVSENEAGDLSAEFRVRPERFPFDASFKQVDRFTATHPAYIEVRP